MSDRLIIDKTMLKIVCLVFFACGIFIGGVIAVLALAAGGRL